MAHKLSSYKDGNVSVPFCELCGAEGLKLFEDCPQDRIFTVKEIIEDLNKPVDKKMEQD